MATEHGEDKVLLVNVFLVVIMSKKVIIILVNC